MTRRPNALAPLPSIMASLDQASWGDLRGREWHGVRAILRGVCAIVNFKTGTGAGTAAQVADAAGYSVKSAERYLPELERMGALTWTRGGILNGRTVPGYFRVSKRWLLALAASGRVSLAEIRAKRAEQRARRVEGIAFAMPGRYRRRSAHADITSGLDTPSVETPSSATEERALPQPASPTAECDHGFAARRMANGLPECPICRRHEQQLLTHEDAA